jgi:hypothetical protein
MVQLLVQAGANLEATLQPGSDSDALPPGLSRAMPLALAAADGKIDVMQVLLGEWQLVITGSVVYFCSAEPAVCFADSNAGDELNDVYELLLSRPTRWACWCLHVRCFRTAGISCSAELTVNMLPCDTHGGGGR